MFLSNAQKRLYEWGIVNANEIKPCSVEEVRLLQKIVNINLPEAYQEFLLLMGHGAGCLFEGSHIFYKDIIQIQKWAVDLLAENHFPVTLPNDAIVIMMHQGYQFMFLCSSHGNNPPIYYYNEAITDQDFVCLHTNLNDFLINEIENTAKVIKTGKWLL